MGEVESMSPNSPIADQSIAGQSIVDLDQRYVWHPFTQEQTAPPPLPVVRGKGATLYLEDGRELLDMACSWWVNVHGHAHPAIAEALAEQARTLEHVIFAGFTHPPAARLAAELVRLLPRSPDVALERVFYSDNGSTAVEVGLKMAFQYWRNLGVQDRTLFLALDDAYHGDTFGAMSVGKSSGFYPQFEDLLFAVRHLPFVETWQGDASVDEREALALAEVECTLEACGHNVAAFLAEPLVQGASGMRMCRPRYLRALCELMRQRGIPVIFDEVMTGFGRTGTFFAMEQVGITPDIVCLSKGITGGFLPLAATVASARIYESFLGADFRNAFAHGHSFTANPLGCAAALASLALFETEGTLGRIQRIHAAHGPWLDELARIPGISRPRRLGSIAAVNLGQPGGNDNASDYHAKIGPVVKAQCLERGLLIRPMGNVVYLMPPACTTPAELARAQEGLADILRQCQPG